MFPEASAFQLWKFWPVSAQLSSAIQQETSSFLNSNLLPLLSFCYLILHLDAVNIPEFDVMAMFSSLFVNKLVFVWLPGAKRFFSLISLSISCTPDFTCRPVEIYKDGSSLVFLISCCLQVSEQKLWPIMVSPCCEAQVVVVIREVWALWHSFRTYILLVGFQYVNRQSHSCSDLVLVTVLLPAAAWSKGFQSPFPTMIYTQYIGRKDTPCCHLI